jgi:hypothetical protein
MAEDFIEFCNSDLILLERDLPDMYRPAPNCK